MWACVRAALNSWLRLAALLQGWVEEGEEEEHYGAGGGDGEEVDDEEDEQFVQQAGKSTADAVGLCRRLLWSTCSGTGIPVLPA